jgi:Mrp family chromosome partitioning ATPase
MNAAVTAALSSRVALEADLEQIRKVGPTNTAELLKIPSVATLPEILLAKQQLSGARSELSSMEGHYLDKNPKHIDAVNKVKGLESNLASVASRAGTQVEQQYESAKQTEAKMESQLKAQEDATMKLNALAIPYNTLLQQVATDQALYEAVIGRRNETGVATGVASVPFHIIERAMVPAKASHPNYVKTLALGFFGLSLLAIILIVITDESRGSIRSVSEAESSLKLPVLAAIPDNRINFFKRFRLRFLAVFTIFKGHAKPSPADKTANTPKNVPYSDVKSKYPIIMLDDPGSHIAESYRAMRASIALLPKDQSQLLLFTSCAPDEGKTFSSLNYSVSLAQAGFKTLIVDTDLRRPSLHEALLGGEISPGLSDYLSGKNTLEQVILPTRVEHLFLITAGTFLKNPAELIERADLVDLAEKLKEHHERVILDSAPVNAVSYTLLIASALKQVILVVRAELTPSVVIKRSLEILKCKSGANILGIVLNRLTPGASAYHFYHYYGDKYVKNSVYGTGRTIW